jgi:hypothetical protein
MSSLGQFRWDYEVQLPGVPVPVVGTIWASDGDAAKVELLNWVKSEFGLGWPGEGFTWRLSRSGLPVDARRN